MVLLASQIFVLLSIAYQDFKSRAISWFFIPLLLSAGIAGHWDNLDWLYLDWLRSIAFILVQLGVVYLYFALKFRSFKFQFADGLIGWGDILFLVAVIPFFSFKNYVLYYVLSLVFALSCHIIAKAINKKAFSSIPLLGWLGIFFSVVLVINYLG